jgi:hypothetical protein
MKSPEGAMTTKPIRCSCGALFGNEEGDTLNIKARDIYRSIKGGVVTGPCRKCGAIMRWPLTIEKGK